MSELVEDAFASWCGDIVGHFLLIRNGFEKLAELKFEFFSFFQVQCVFLTATLIDNVFIDQPNGLASGIFISDISDLKKYLT